MEFSLKSLLSLREDFSNSNSCFLAKSEIKSENVPTAKSVKRGIYELNYKKLIHICPEISEQRETSFYVQIECKPYMNLNIDYDSNAGIIILSHYYIQNSDVMDDPCMYLKVNFENQTLEALSFQQSNPFVYSEVYTNGENGEKLVNLSIKRKLNKFLEQWLKNLKSQGFSDGKRNFR